MCYSQLHNTEQHNGVLTALNDQGTVLCIHWVQTEIHITLSCQCYPTKKKDDAQRKTSTNHG